MFEIPLFPLQTVLFPASPLELTISNRHYLPLIADCLHYSQPFGAVLVQSGNPENSLQVMPHTIGCAARIFVFEMVAEDTLKVLALGIERFRILGLNYNQPYLVGRVEFCPFQVDDPVAVTEADQILRPLVVRYLTRLADVHQLPFDADQLPTAPVALACLSAYLLQIPPEQKQLLLTTDDTVELINSTTTLYERELALLDAQLSHPDPGLQGPFSFN